jgi:hypothetical protein
MNMRTKFSMRMGVNLSTATQVLRKFITQRVKFSHKTPGGPITLPLFKKEEVISFQHPLTPYSIQFTTRLLKADKGLGLEEDSHVTSQRKT